MADAFPGSVLVFDAANRAAVKMIAKTWLKSAKIKDVGAYFAVSDAPQEIGAWDSRLQVSSRGYMLGYTDLKDPSVSGFFPFSRKGRRRHDENADREDRIWRQEMKSSKEKTSAYCGHDVVACLLLLFVACARRRPAPTATTQPTEVRRPLS